MILIKGYTSKSNNQLAKATQKPLEEKETGGCGDPRERERVSVEFLRVQEVFFICFVRIFISPEKIVNFLKFWD